MVDWELDCPGVAPAEVLARVPMVDPAVVEVPEADQEAVCRGFLAVFLLLGCHQAVGVFHLFSRQAVADFHQVGREVQEARACPAEAQA